MKFPTYVRINTLSISIENCLCAFFKEGWNLLPRCESYSDHLQMIANLRDKNFIKDYHISELLVFPPETIFYDHPGYLRGKFLLQDKVCFDRYKNYIQIRFFFFFLILILILI